MHQPHPLADHDAVLDNFPRSPLWAFKLGVKPRLIHQVTMVTFAGHDVKFQHTSRGNLFLDPGNFNVIRFRDDDLNLAVAVRTHDDFLESTLVEPVSQGLNHGLHDTRILLLTVLDLVDQDHATLQIDPPVKLKFSVFDVGKNNHCRSDNGKANQTEMTCQVFRSKDFDGEDASQRKGGKRGQHHEDDQQQLGPICLQPV